MYNKYIKSLLLLNLFVFSFFIYSSKVHAAYFPNDSLTLYSENATTTASKDVFTTPSGQVYTILKICSISTGSTNNVTVTDAGGQTIYVIKDFPLGYPFTVGTNNPSEAPQRCWEGTHRLTSVRKIVANKGSTDGKQNVWVTYVPYDLAAVTKPEALIAATNIAISDLNTDVDSINSKLDILITFFTGGRFAAMVSWIIVGIYAFFTIMFMKWLYRIFFSRF